MDATQELLHLPKLAQAGASLLRPDEASNLPKPRLALDAVLVHGLAPLLTRRVQKRLDLPRFCVSLASGRAHARHPLRNRCSLARNSRSTVGTVRLALMTWNP